MNFEEKLRALLERLENSLACVLMGFDGIPLASATRPGVNLDLELMGAEASVIMNQLRQAAFTAQFGCSGEACFRSEETTILIRVLTQNYFLVLITRPEAYVGKGRFLARAIEPDLLRELE